MRVIVIDNSAGSLEASDPHQNPPEAQRPWLHSGARGARAAGIPAIVIGSRDLNSRFNPALNIATDADQTARRPGRGRRLRLLLRAPRGEPRLPHSGGGAATIPAFGTGTLGYRSPPATRSHRQPDSLFGDRASCSPRSTSRAARSRTTNRAPVTRAADPGDRRPVAAGGRRHASAPQPPGAVPGPRPPPDRGRSLGRASSSDGNASPPGSDPYTSLPPVPCLVAGCSTRVRPEYQFHSSDPDIGDFVQQDPQLDQPAQAAARCQRQADRRGRVGSVLRLQRGHDDGHRAAPGGLTFAAARASAARAACSARAEPSRCDPDRFRQRPTAAPVAPPPAPRPGLAETPPVSFTLRPRRTRPPLRNPPAKPPVLSVPPSPPRSRASTCRRPPCRAPGRRRIRPQPAQRRPGRAPTSTSARRSSAPEEHAGLLRATSPTGAIAGRLPVRRSGAGGGGRRLDLRRAARPRPARDRRQRGRARLRDPT